MIILDNTNRSLQFALGSPVAANQLPFVATFIDITATAFTPATNEGVSNNTTAVALAAAPTGSNQRQVKYVSIYNADTANVTVTIQYNDNSTLRTLGQFVLNPTETLQYTDLEGWQILNPILGAQVDVVPPGVVLLAAKQVTVNFGATPTDEMLTTVVDASVTAQTPIMVGQDGGPTPDKSQMGDENEMDPIEFNAQPGAGQFTLRGASQAGPVVGQYKANYIVLPSLSVSTIIGPNNLSAPLLAWYKASDFDLIANGSDVSQWNDLSGNSIHAPAIGGAGNRPTVSRNALNTTMTALANNASNRGFSTGRPNLTSLGSWGFYIVLNVTSTPGTPGGFFGIDESSFPGGRFNITTGLAFQATFFNPADGITNGILLTNTWYYIVASYSHPNWTIYFNNTAQVMNNQPTSDMSDNSAVFLFESYDGRFGGLIAEFALFNAALNSGDVASLTGYSRSRYGLQ